MLEDSLSSSPKCCPLITVFYSSLCKPDAQSFEQVQAAHISIGDRIWSNLPFLRPLATVVDDTLAAHGTDAEGGRVSNFWNAEDNF